MIPKLRIEGAPATAPETLHTPESGNLRGTLIEKSKNKGKKFIFVMPDAALADAVVGNTSRLLMSGKPIPTVISRATRELQPAIKKVATARIKEAHEIIEMAELLQVELAELDSEISESTPGSQEDLALTERKKFLAHAATEFTPENINFQRAKIDALETIRKDLKVRTRKMLASIDPICDDVEIIAHGGPGLPKLYSKQDTSGPSWSMEKVADELKDKGAGLRLQHQRIKLTSCGSADATSAAPAPIRVLAQALASRGYGKATIKGYHGNRVMNPQVGALAPSQRLPDGSIVPASTVTETIKTNNL